MVFEKGVDPARVIAQQRGCAVFLKPVDKIVRAHKNHMPAAFKQNPDGPARQRMGRQIIGKPPVPVNHGSGHRSYQQVAVRGHANSLDRLVADLRIH